MSFRLYPFIFGPCCKVRALVLYLLSLIYIEEDGTRVRLSLAAKPLFNLDYRSYRKFGIPEVISTYNRCIVLCSLTHSIADIFIQKLKAQCLALDEVSLENLASIGIDRAKACSPADDVKQEIRLCSLSNLLRAHIKPVRFKVEQQLSIFCVNTLYVFILAGDLSFRSLQLDGRAVSAGQRRIISTRKYHTHIVYRPEVGGSAGHFGGAVSRRHANRRDRA